MFVKHCLHFLKSSKEYAIPQAWHVICANLKKMKNFRGENFYDDDKRKYPAMALESSDIYFISKTDAQFSEGFVAGLLVIWQILGILLGCIVFMGVTLCLVTIGGAYALMLDRWYATLNKITSPRLSARHPLNIVFFVATLFGLHFWNYLPSFYVPNTYIVTKGETGSTETGFLEIQRFWLVSCFPVPFMNHLHSFRSLGFVGALSLGQSIEWLFWLFVLANVMVNAIRRFLYCRWGNGWLLYVVIWLPTAIGCVVCFVEDRFEKTCMSELQSLFSPTTAALAVMWGWGVWLRWISFVVIPATTTLLFHESSRHTIIRNE